MKCLQAAALCLLLAACSSAPFSYSEDRCLGANNQCRNACTGIENGPARSACEQRCYDNETRCYATGATGDGESLATEDAIGAARTQAEKEAAYKRWKAKKERERDAANNANE